MCTTHEQQNFFFFLPHFVRSSSSVSDILPISLHGNSQATDEAVSSVVVMVKQKLLCSNTDDQSKAEWEGGFEVCLLRC